MRNKSKYFLSFIMYFFCAKELGQKRLQEPTAVLSN